MKAPLVFVLSCLCLCNASSVRENVDLDTLNLQGLLNAVKENEHLLSSAVKVFQRKYSKNPIYIQGPFYPDSKSLILEFYQQIQIQHFDVALEVLTYFGDSIIDLRIAYASINYEQSENVTQAVNKYCSKSLIYLQLQHCKSDTFKYFEKPFGNVSMVHITGVMSTLDSETLKFNETFPKLSHLILNLMRVSDMHSLEVNFPHLVHIDLKVRLETEQDITFQYADRLLRKNSQIRSLRIWYPTQKCLKMISENAPNLEIIDIYTNLKKLKEMNETRFERVKKLTLYTTKGATFPKNVLFPQLEDLFLSSASNDTNSFATFIAQHSKIRELRFENMVHDEGLKIMTGKLPQLSEAIIGIGGDVQSETLSKFLSSCGALTRLDLIVSMEISYEAISLKIQQLTVVHGLTAQWNITIYNKNISFSKNALIKVV